MTKDVDEFLAHYGIPGMRWGKRNASSDSGSSGKGSSSKEEKAPKAKKPTSDDIKAARSRQSERSMKVGLAEYEYMAATSKKGKQKAYEALDKAGDEYFNSPDRAIANRKTRGEKAAAALSWGVIGLSAASLAAR